MPVRPLDILDLPAIYKYRRQVVALDSARAATHGNLLGFKALLSYLNPRSEISTAIYQQNGNTLLGQVTHTDGSPHANLAFLAPVESSEAAEADLLDYLAKQAGAGGWGCLHVLAEVDEGSPLVKSLRQCGFSLYAWQRVWKLPQPAPPAGGAGGSDEDNSWTETQEIDLVSIQNLYSQIVPAMLQPIEPLPRRATGLVCHHQGELQAYLNLTYGPTGIWTQPLIHPDAGCLAEWMSAMQTSIPNRLNRPVYVCVRSYQAWLESLLEELGAQAGQRRQAVMIKHLAAMKWAEESLPVKKADAHAAWAKPATPVARIKPTDGES
jgi:hypothetical protein